LIFNYQLRAIAGFIGQGAIFSGLSGWFLCRLGLLERRFIACFASWQSAFV